MNTLERNEREMGKRILSIGDRPNIQALVRDILEEEGYDVVIRETPFQEITEIEELSPDLIILRLMRFANSLGRQTLTLLSREPAATSFPVLAFFAAPEDILEQDQHLRRKNVFFVSWPYDTESFLAAIRQVLQTGAK